MPQVNLKMTPKRILLVIYLPLHFYASLSVNLDTVRNFLVKPVDPLSNDNLESDCGWDHVDICGEATSSFQKLEQRLDEYPGFLKELVEKLGFPLDCASKKPLQLPETAVKWRSTFCDLYMKNFLRKIDADLLSYYNEGTTRLLSRPPWRLLRGLSYLECCPKIFLRHHIQIFEEVCPFRHINDRVSLYQAASAVVPKICLLNNNSPQRSWLASSVKKLVSTSRVLLPGRSSQVSASSEGELQCDSHLKEAYCSGLKTSKRDLIRTRCKVLQTLRYSRLSELKEKVPAVLEKLATFIKDYKSVCAVDESSPGVATDGKGQQLSVPSNGDGMVSSAQTSQTDAEQTSKLESTSVRLGDQGSAKLEGGKARQERANLASAPLVAGNEEQHQKQNFISSKRRIADQDLATYVADTLKLFESASQNLENLPTEITS